MRLAFLLTILVLLASPVMADTIIDTTISDGGFISGLGPDHAFGQTFTVSTADTHLSRFSLFLEGFQPGTMQPMNLRGIVAEWNTAESRPGATLFVSGITQVVPAGLQEFAFTPEIDLARNERYVAFLSTIDVPQPPLGPGERLLYDVKVTRMNVLVNESLVFGAEEGPWSAFGLNEMWFKARLAATVVPEPATLLLVGVGIVGLAAVRRFPFI
jgi:hypothetical protein